MVPDQRFVLDGGRDVAGYGVFVSYLVSRETYLPQDKFQQNGKNTMLAVPENLHTKLVSAH